jgi:hypothetical protein
LIAAVLAPGTVSFSTEQLREDFGFCGVRNGQCPTADLNEVYVIRNKCNLMLNVAAGRQERPALPLTPEITYTQHR